MVCVVEKLSTYLESIETGEESYMMMTLINSENQNKDKDPIAFYLYILSCFPDSAGWTGCNHGPTYVIISQEAENCF